MALNEENSIYGKIRWTLVLLFVAFCCGEAKGQRGDLKVLPSVAGVRPVRFEHFPSLVHALVFRNWNVVDVDRIARVIGATREQVLEIGQSMGLPPAQPIPDEYRQRMYLTVIRRNWHLLRYDQLLELLDVSAEELAVILREDDFLWVKLGQLKPCCALIRYKEPTEEIKDRAAKIKAIIQETFGEELKQPPALRFEFVREFSKPMEKSIETPESVELESPVAPRFSTRIVYSYVAVFGDPLLDDKIDPFPDGLLERLAAVGVNGVWLHVVLRDLAPGGAAFPEFGKNHEIRLANLRKLAQHAARYGIGIYLYQNEPRAMPKAFFKDRLAMAGVDEGDFTAMCTSSPGVRAWISDALAYVFREVPELAGVFTITASENLTNCASHGQQKNCPHCKERSAAEIIAEVNTAIRDGVHRSKPDAKVIAWDWGWNSHGDATDHIAAMPEGTCLMSVSEWALPIERGGIKSEIGEYSMSAVGPGPRATKHWQAARDRGLNTFAKVQFNNTWELAAVPYLPVLDLVAEHCHKLASAGVDGLFMSWSLGGYPSVNFEVARQFDAEPLPDVETVLMKVARRHYGNGASDARGAWRAFSTAFREYPYHINVVYTGPQLFGPSNFLFERPTDFNATMSGFPYDDLASWRGPYPPEVFIKQFERVVSGWTDGLALLNKAADAAPADRKAEAQADLRVAEAALLHFQSVVNQSKFVFLRNQALENEANRELKAANFAQLKSIAADEARIARRMFTLASQDSRIGFEASNQYLYVPTDFLEKVLNCHWVIEQLER